MNIKSVSAVYPKYRHVVPSWRTHFWQIVVRVETDAGIVGVGYGGGGVAAVEVVNRHFNELIAGRQLDAADDIQKIWDDLYLASLPYGRKGIAIMALSGLDLALWDALGKAESKPVYELLGGFASRECARMRREPTRSGTQSLDSPRTSSLIGGRVLRLITIPRLPQQNWPAARWARTPSS